MSECQTCQSCWLDNWRHSQFHAGVRSLHLGIDSVTDIRHEEGADPFVALVTSPLCPQC